MQHPLTLPAFDRAINSFELFLAERGYSGKVLWIFREDITWHGGKLFVKLPLPGENQSLIPELYKSGSERGLGLSIDMFCLVSSQPCCYIWLPENENDAHVAQLAGLKLSAPSKPLVAQPVFSNVLWNFHVWLDGKAGGDRWFDRLPVRGETR